MKPIFRAAVAAFVSALALCTTAQAETYPSKPITVIVPYAPGGITDGLGRQVSQFLSQHFKQSVVVDNRPGGGASIGGRLLSTAKPDGYTIGVFDITGIAITPQLYQKPPYDSVKGFVPVTRLGNNYQIIVAALNSPINTVADLMAAARKKPGIPIATPAPYNHIEFARLADMAKIEFSNVAYKGSTPLMQDVMGNQIELAYLDVASAFQYVRSGKVKPIAVSSKSRLDLLPNVPTLVESGFPQYEASAWFGVIAPAGTPKAIVDRLDAALQQFGRSDAYRAWARDRSFFPDLSANAEAFGGEIPSQAERYRTMGQRLNLRLD